MVYSAPAVGFAASSAVCSTCSPEPMSFDLFEKKLATRSPRTITMMAIRTNVPYESCQLILKFRKFFLGRPLDITNLLSGRGFFKKDDCVSAVATGFEPAIFTVTGRRVGPTTLRDLAIC